MTDTKRYEIGSLRSRNKQQAHWLAYGTLCEDVLKRYDLLIEIHTRQYEKRTPHNLRT